MKTNYHTHTTFCDGKNTPEEMIEAARAKGFAALGFSSHSDMLTDAAAYRAEIRRLAEVYRDRISIKLGIEAELAKPWTRVPGEYDYVIGSVHYLPNDVCVDYSPEATLASIRDVFNGDAVAYVKAYFAAVRETLSCDFDIVGHPDLVRKFNTKQPLFDENADWYHEELVKTADAIAASGKLVEVNTGAISRGWMDDAYPSVAFRELLRARGVKFILSSDAHAAAGLDCAFDRFGTAEDFVDLI